MVNTTIAVIKSLTGVELQEFNEKHPRVESGEDAGQFIEKEDAPQDTPVITHHDIISSRWAFFKSDFDKLARKAEKLGITPPRILEIGRRTMKEVTVNYVDEMGNPISEQVVKEVIPVKIEGTDVGLKGWHVVAIIQHDSDAGNTIVNIDKDFEVDKKYRDPERETLCEHCKQKRVRNNTYLLKNSDTGEVKEVGSNCLKDFTKVRSAEAIARWQESLTLMLSQEAEEGFWRMGGGAQQLDLKEYMAVVAGVIAEKGFVPRSMEQFGKSSTASAATERYTNRRRSVALGRDVEQLPVEHIQHAEEVIAWARNISEDTDSDYLWNLRTAMMFDRTPSKKDGIIASAFKAFDRAHGSAEERKIKEKTGGRASEFVGEVDGKIPAIDGKGEGRWLTLSKQFKSDTIYGTLFTNIFLDELGNVFVWGTSHNDKGMKEGGRFFVEGTIKEHSPYTGRNGKTVNQTRITRAKILTPKDVDAINADAQRLLEGKARVKNAKKLKVGLMSSEEHEQLTADLYDFNNRRKFFDDYYDSASLADYTVDIVSDVYETSTTYDQKSDLIVVDTRNQLGKNSKSYMTRQEFTSWVRDLRNKWQEEKAVVSPRREKQLMEEETRRKNEEEWERYKRGLNDAN